MKEITVEELKEKIDRNENFQLIDVRESYEYEICNLNGELIPMSTVLDNMDKIAKDKPVIIHCKSGGRSGVIVMELERRFGMTNLYNLKGGILAYSRNIDPSIPIY
ncbi:MAG: rhodanese-like domain-containing protein [Bacteroidetes bacterium]|nr:rhodanese-like domain-containing protein [Bacteroidota bacterium]MBL0063988.1 rhodanese-like domain-containing protein [Bacteroidota bacterium]MBL0139627.1 rhodanese-like domain-containing protein [Bacteroidota bacterium]